MWSKCLAGFSLVEMVIVVAIIALLAAVIIPKMSSSADAIKYKQMCASQMTLQNAVDQYVQDHRGSHLWGVSPTGTEVVLRLTGQTNRVGQIPLDGEQVFGPYIENIPVNPLLGADAYGIATQTESELTPCYAQAQGNDNSAVQVPSEECAWILNTETHAISPYE